MSEEADISQVARTDCSDVLMYGEQEQKENHQIHFLA